MCQLSKNYGTKTIAGLVEKTMKILYVIKTNRGAKWAYEQALWLFRHGLDLTVVIPEESGDYADLYRSARIKVIRADCSLPVSKPWLLSRRIRTIRQIVETEQPDLIHCHFVTNILMMRLALRNSSIPRLFQVPGPLHLESCIFRKLDVLSATAADYWAPACRLSFQKYLQAGISSKRLFLAYYGSESYAKTFETTGQLRSEFGLSPDSRLVAMVCYFYKPKRYLGQRYGLKGHEDFIDAMRLLLHDYPDITGVIVGGPFGTSQRYMEQVQAYARRRCGDKILFTGFRKDVLQIYREFDVAVHPSHSENLGGAAESLAAAVPTVSTDVGGFPDIVIDGKTGYTVPAKSPRRLAQAIERMLIDPEQATQMALQGQREVRELLDLDRTAGLIEVIYSQILQSEQ